MRVHLYLPSFRLIVSNNYSSEQIEMFFSLLGYQWLTPLPPAGAGGAVGDGMEEACID